MITLWQASQVQHLQIVQRSSYDLCKLAFPSPRRPSPSFLPPCSLCSQFVTASVSIYPLTRLLPKSFGQHPSLPATLVWLWSNQMPPCHVCSAEDASPCGGCGNVSYCGRACQRTDWKRHKAVCKCYKISRAGPEQGNHLLASRYHPSVRDMRVRCDAAVWCCLCCHGGCTLVMTV